MAYVARQVGVPASDLGFYEWDGRTVEYHRAQVRKFLGFRECTVTDAEKLAAWLAGEVCQSERRAERVREELLQRCRQEGYRAARSTSTRCRSTGRGPGPAAL